MKTSLVALAILVSAALILPGCPPKKQGPVVDVDTPLPPGELALRKITDAKDIPDFTTVLQQLLDQDKRSRDPNNRYPGTGSLRSSISYSLHYFSKPSAAKYYPYGGISKDLAVSSLQRFDALVADLQAGKTSPQQMNQILRQDFDTYISVGYNMKGDVRFTAYYTPVIEGSLTQTPRFKYPLYSLPEDHHLNAQGETVAMTQYDRRAIEKGNLLRGKELVWLDDPFLVYVVQVQGSAVVKLTDGTKALFGYAGNNGQEYRSIRNDLIEQGKIPKDRISLKTMIEYFKAHPNDVNEFVWKNPRFVFFARNNDPFPHGSLNEPVTAMRSVATDKSIFPRACLAFVSTTMRWQENTLAYYQAFSLDQDTGGGIRAAGHCDLYLGIDTYGTTADLAGRTVQEGRLYYLFLKSNNVTKPAPSVSPTPPPPPPLNTGAEGGTKQ